MKQSFLSHLYAFTLSLTITAAASVFFFIATTLCARMVQQ